MPTPANVRRHFLPWDRPLLGQMVDWLAGAWTGRGPLDLSDWLVVVPTRQSGRRLREALAAHAARYDSAVFPPHVLTPEALVQPAASMGTASRLESMLAWMAVLREVELEEFAAVFPVEPPRRDFAWAWRLAEDVTRLQGHLAENGLRMADVPERAGEDFAEADRWQALAGLERLHAAQLAVRGLHDAQTGQIAAAQAPQLPPGVKRIAMLGTPDPLPLALRALAVHAASLPVEILVLAPGAEAGSFDGWGRPEAAVWTQRELVLPDFEARVHLQADPAAQADHVTLLARGYGEPEGFLGVGVADAEVLPLLENGLRQAGLAGYNPEGRSRQGDRLHQLLTALAGLAREASFSAVTALARCPDFLEYLRAQLGESFSAARFLGELDELQARHLPPDLAEARRHAPGHPALDVVAALRRRLTTGGFPGNVQAVLEEMFAARHFDPARPEEAAAAESAQAWAGVVRELAEAAPRFPQMTDAEWWEVALRLYAETAGFDDKPAGALELQGWLELLWEDAPHLVVAGMNDGAVPDAVVGDAFLPESLRERLGLKSNAARFARDAYLLQALAATRRGGGRLDLVLGKVSAAGDPRRPSRLLLRCADAVLPQRIGFLFRPVETAQPNPPWHRAWRLQPPRAAAPARVAVTALRAWLDCPFRFYLSRVLGLEAVDPAKTELDAMDFGTLCHSALEAMGREPALRDCTEAGAIREFLLAALEREANRRFGAELTLPLIVQLESARQRLSRLADVQAQTRAEGWIIEHVERSFELGIGDLLVRGKIDRIDRHEGTGAVRVLDYKTSDQPVAPPAAHLRAARRAGETAPAFARWTGSGRELVWCDLQLPLYLRALAAEFPGDIACGYFNLPKAASETGIAQWPDYNPELAAAAWACAQGVAAAIRAGEYWPPNETLRPQADDFAALFHHGAAASVAWREATP